MRIVLLQSDLFGDVIVATPLLRQLRTALPQARVTLMLGPKNRAIRPLLGELIDDVLHYDKRPLALFRLFFRARTRRFDYLLDLVLDPLKVSRVLVPLVGAKRSIGFDNGNAQLHDLTIKGGLDAPVAERFLSFLKPLGVTLPADPKLELFVPAAADEWARRNWPVTFDRPAILVNIRGAGPDKFWGVDRYVRWISAVRAAHPQFQFTVVGHGQENDVATICEQAQVPPLLPAPDFSHFAASVKLADYVISPDTAVIHLAAAFQKPVLGLYRTRVGDHNWTPYRSPYIIVKSPTEQVGDIALEAGIDAFSRLMARTS